MAGYKNVHDKMAKVGWIGLTQPEKEKRLQDQGITDEEVVDHGNGVQTVNGKPLGVYLHEKRTGKKVKLSIPGRN